MNHSIRLLMHRFGQKKKNGVLCVGMFLFVYLHMNGMFRLTKWTERNTKLLGKEFGRDLSLKTTSGGNGQWPTISSRAGFPILFSPLTQLPAWYTSPI